MVAHANSQSHERTMIGVVAFRWLCVTLLICSAQAVWAEQARTVVQLLQSPTAADVSRGLEKIPKVPAADRPQLFPLLTAIIGDPVQGIRPNGDYATQRLAWQSLAYVGPQGIERLKNMIMKTRTDGADMNTALVDAAAEALVSAGSDGQNAVQEILAKGSPDAVARLTMFLNAHPTTQARDTSPVIETFNAQIAALDAVHEPSLCTAIGELAASSPVAYKQLLAILPDHAHQTELLAALCTANLRLMGERIQGKPRTKDFPVADAGQLLNTMLSNGQITGSPRLTAAQAFGACATADQLNAWLEAGRQEFLGMDADFYWLVITIAANRAKAERLRVNLPVAEAQAVLEGAPNQIPPIYAKEVQRMAQDMLAIARDAGLMGGIGPASPTANSPTAVAGPTPDFLVPTELPFGTTPLELTDFLRQSAVANQSATKLASSATGQIKRIEDERIALLNAEKPAGIPALLGNWRQSGSWIKRMRPAGEMGGQKMVQEVTNPAGERLVTKVRAYNTDLEDYSKAITSATATLVSCETAMTSMALLVLHGKLIDRPESLKVVEQLVRSQVVISDARKTLSLAIRGQNGFADARAVFIDPIKKEINDGANKVRP